jgi:DNA-binding MarR family transcriptional regulator
LRQPTRNRSAWRHANVGRLLNNAVRRFEGRVLDLMGEAGYAQTRIAHVGLTRNLDVEGTRLTELARRASMSKQAMGELVEQCEAMGLVARAPDPSDGRARIITFTAAGLEWLDAFRAAVDVAEQEMRGQLGAAAMDTLVQALATYGANFGTLNASDE